MSAAAGLSTGVVLGSLDRLFAARSTTAAIPRHDGSNPYLLAAAVLHVFDPKEVQPYGAVSDATGSYAILFDNTAPAIGWRNMLFRYLKPDARLTALRVLGSRAKMRQALSKNPGRELTDVQRFFEKWIEEKPIALDELSYNELENLRQLYEWGIAEFGGLPERSEFEAVRRRRSAVAVFEHLVDSNFTGRQPELQLLRDYVGVVSPSVWSRVRSFLRPGPRAPFVVWGPGGVGKTALIGRFLMEHVNAGGAGWFPFAYLMFDSRTIDVSEPYTLLLECTAQLENQVGATDGAGERDPALTRAFSDFRSTVARYRDRRGGLGQRTLASSATGTRLQEVSQTDRVLYASFVTLLHQVSSVAGAQQDAQNIPVLLVFDTFEEVLYRTREDLLGLWQMLDALQSGFTNLRVVISGRSEPRSFTLRAGSPTIRRLSDLTDIDAFSLVTALGVADEAVGRAIVHQVGGNPLSLRLAARVAEREGSGERGIAGLQTRKYWFFELAPELVRGQLYRRLLDHIHDPNVRALAHPGMVLRRVTSEIIEQVLAPACDLPAVDRNRAEKLFEGLRQEHALVRLDDDTSLRYREEVRRPVLDLLAHDRPRQVQDIHLRIVNYYEGAVAASLSRGPPLVERAEEIYHRLMLGQQADVLNGRWVSGLERFLASAIEEVPLAQRIWLASRMSIELPKEVYAAADTAQWEQLCGRRALQALRYEGPAGTLQLLRERSERTPQSPLFAIEARALMALGRDPEAASILDGAISGYPPFGNSGRLAELLWLRAQVSLTVGQKPAAAEFLRRLAELAENLTTPLPLLQALTELVAVDDALDPNGRTAARESLATALGRLSPDQIDRERALVRLALVRLGSDFPSLLGRLAPLVIHELFYSVRRNLVDLRPMIENIITLLESSEQQELAKLASSLAETDDPVARENFLRLIAEAIDTERLRPIDQEQPRPWVNETVLLLMKAEAGTLAGATLAGLDEYREPWELNVSPEALA